MDVVIVLVFISLVLVVAGLIFFMSRLREGDFDHGERLALSPLLDDEEVTDNQAPEAVPASHTHHEKPNNGEPGGRDSTCR